MTRKQALVLAAVPALLLTGAAITWAYDTVGPAWFATFATATVLLALLFGLFCRLTGGLASEGRHAGSSTSRSEGGRALPPVAAARPVRAASGPPAEFLAAPVAAPPGVTYGPMRSAPPVAFTHDEFAPDQAYNGHAHMDGGVLTPVLAPALLAVAFLRVHIAVAIITDAQHEPFERWLSDTFVGALPALTPGQIALMDAEHAEAGEAA